MKRLILPILLAGTLSVLSAETNAPVAAQPSKTQKVSFMEVKHKQMVHMNYLVHLPRTYDVKGPRLPMILFLHGAGERGLDPWKVKVHGPPRIADKNPDFPFVVISPQCPSGSWWNNESLNLLLDEVLAKYHVDPDRVYLTGLSMGGFGSWNLALANPERFAAVAPICGGGMFISAYLMDKKKGQVLKDLPFWAFHGARDTVVQLEESERMVNGLKNYGVNVKLTVYPEAQHDSWTETYNNPELYAWFLQHRRKSQ